MGLDEHMRDREGYPKSIYTLSLLVIMPATHGSVKYFVSTILINNLKQLIRRRF